MSGYNTALDALVASLATALPTRHVQRSLIDPASVKADKLQAGVLCVVSQSGGKFAQYIGRLGELGTLKVALVGFVSVPEKSEPADIERAELALLEQLLEWVGSSVPGVNAVYLMDWTQSQQLEHPFGWLVLNLEVRT
jgi:hypothetical protein